MRCALVVLALCVLLVQSEELIDYNFQDSPTWFSNDELSPLPSYLFNAIQSPAGSATTQLGFGLPYTIRTFPSYIAHYLD